MEHPPSDAPPLRRLKHEHYIPAIDAALKEAREEVDNIINSTEQPTFQNTVVALETSGEKLEQVTSVLFNMNSAETDDSLQGPSHVRSHQSFQSLEIIYH